MRQQNGTVPPFEICLVLLLGILWGVPYALTKISLQTIQPITMVAARVTLAAAALWIIAILLGRKIPKRRDFVGRLFIQGGLACVIPYTLIAFGQQSVDSALAAILNSTTPLFVCLISVMWTHHEPMTFGRVSGVTVGLGGVVMIAGASALLGLGRETASQAAILLATLSSAASVIHGRRFFDVAPEITAAGTLTCAAIVLVPLSFVLESPFHASPSAASATALLVNAVIATACGFVVYFRLIRTVGSMGTASIGYLKPGIGVLIGCALMGEFLTWVMGFGLLAIFFGVAAINEKLSEALISDLFSRTQNRFLRRASTPVIATGRDSQG